MAQALKVEVPKFTSFKSKAPPRQASVISTEDGPGANSGRATERESHRKDSARHRSKPQHHHARNRNRSDQRLEHSSRRQQGGKDGSLSDILPPHPSTLIREDDIDESPTFIIDRTGDSKNVEYGSLHRYSVPAYHRCGKGSVIGIANHGKIDRDQSSEKGVVVNNGARSQHAARPLTRKQHRPNARPLRVVPHTEPQHGNDFNISTDFIAISTSRKRKRGSKSPLSDYDQNLRDYISTQGAAEADYKPDDQDLEQVSDAELEDTLLELQLRAQQQNSELSLKTKTNLQDVRPWQALIDHQERLIKPGFSVVGFSSADTRALADLRLSIYEKALKHVNKDQKGHEDLLMGLMEQGSMLWESSKLTKEWAEILKDNASDFRLWTKYLDFVQTNPVTFKYEDCKRSYLQCLDVLQKVEREKLSRDSRSDLASIRIYVILRLMRLVSDAGYDELAIAIWQSLLELQFFSPANHAALSREEMLSAFEEFWESEWTRIGEEGALGWQHFAQTGGQRLKRGRSSKLERIGSQNPFRDWANDELRMTEGLQFPVGPSDEDDDGDVFRVVLYADMHEILDRVHGAVSDKALIRAFLCFMHLPPMQDDYEESSFFNWHTDQYLRRGSCLQHEDRPDYVNNAVRNWGLQSHVVTTSTLFSASSFEPHPHHDQLRNADVTAAGVDTHPRNEMHQFLHRTLASLVKARPEDDQLSVYYLAFELQFFPSEASTAAKKLLKLRPSSLRLYNACAIIESTLGHSKKADHVWSTATTMSMAFPEKARDGLIVLWHSWIWADLDRGKIQAAIGRFAHIAGGESIANVADVQTCSLPSTTRLKAARQLVEDWDRAFSDGDLGTAILYAECLALLEYLAAKTGRLEAALLVLRKYCDLLANYTCRIGVGEPWHHILEALHQAKCRLLSFHIESKRPYKPALIRSELAESISMYPRNTMFLEAYSHNEARLRIDDRVRAVVRDEIAGNTKATVCSWAFAICEEIKRSGSGTSGSNANTVRSTFAKALTAPGSLVSHNAALWFQWLAFEMMTAETALKTEQGNVLKYDRARRVFLEGLRSLPWVKRWITIGLYWLGDDGLGWSADERKRIYDVLIERELRVRVEGLEEALEERKGTNLDGIDTLAR